MDYRAKTQISSFVALYLAIFGIGVFALCALGVSVPDAMFEFSSALGTVGLSRGIMVADAHSAILWIGTFGMFVGRLEIFVVLFAVHKVWTDIRGKRRS
jgi:trk system potassium uptake protein TrkH